MKNRILEMKNTLEGINSTGMKQKTESVSWKTRQKEYPCEATKQNKRPKKYEDSFREIQGNMKHNNTCNVGISEGGKKKQ